MLSRPKRAPKNRRVLQNITSAAEYERVYTSRQRTLMQKAFELEEATGAEVSVTVRSPSQGIAFYASNTVLEEKLKKCELIENYSRQFTKNYFTSACAFNPHFRGMLNTANNGHTVGHNNENHAVSQQTSISMTDQSTPNNGVTSPISQGENLNASPTRSQNKTTGTPQRIIPTTSGSPYNTPRTHISSATTTSTQAPSPRPQQPTKITSLASTDPKEVKKQSPKTNTAQGKKSTPLIRKLPRPKPSFTEAQKQPQLNVNNKQLSDDVPTLESTIRRRIRNQSELSLDINIEVEKMKHPQHSAQIRDESSSSSSSDSDDSSDSSDTTSSDESSSESEDSTSSDNSSSSEDAAESGVPQPPPLVDVKPVIETVAMATATQQGEKDHPDIARRETPHGGEIKGDGTGDGSATKHKNPYEFIGNLTAKKCNNRRCANCKFGKSKPSSHIFFDAEKSPAPNPVESMVQWCKKCKSNTEQGPKKSQKSGKTGNTNQKNNPVKTKPQPNKPTNKKQPTKPQTKTPSKEKSTGIKTNSSQSNEKAQNIQTPNPALKLGSDRSPARPESSEKSVKNRPVEKGGGTGERVTTCEKSVKSASKETKNTLDDLQRSKGEQRIKGNNFETSRSVSPATNSADRKKASPISGPTKTNPTRPINKPKINVTTPSNRNANEVSSGKTETTTSCRKTSPSGGAPERVKPPSKASLNSRRTPSKSYQRSVPSKTHHSRQGRPERSRSPETARQRDKPLKPEKSFFEVPPFPQPESSSISNRTRTRQSMTSVKNLTLSHKSSKPREPAHPKRSLQSSPTKKSNHTNTERKNKLSPKSHNLRSQNKVTNARAVKTASPKEKHSSSSNESRASNLSSSNKPTLQPEQTGLNRNSTKGWRYFESNEGTETNFPRLNSTTGRRTLLPTPPDVTRLVNHQLFDVGSRQKRPWNVPENQLCESRSGHVPAKKPRCSLDRNADWNGNFLKLTETQNRILKLTSLQIRKYLPQANTANGKPRYDRDPPSRNFPSRHGNSRRAST